VEDAFSKPGEAPLTDSPLTWVEGTPATAAESTWEIMGHILPARTLPLGQGEIQKGAALGGASNELNLRGQGYGASNQDHSGQFMSTYAERRRYWDALLVEIPLQATTQAP
jgi:hypothetical protein